MSKTIGLGAEPMKSHMASLEENSKGLQSELDRLRKEKKKMLEENKALKNEMTLLKKEFEEDKQAIAQKLEGKA